MKNDWKKSENKLGKINKKRKMKMKGDIAP